MLSFIQVIEKEEKKDGLFKSISKVLSPRGERTDKSPRELKSPRIEKKERSPREKKESKKLEKVFYIHCFYALFSPLTSRTSQWTRSSKMRRLSVRLC
jgi:hypothetical protein